jgi:hypothetical protein
MAYKPMMDLEWRERDKSVVDFEVRSRKGPLNGAGTPQTGLSRLRRLTEADKAALNKIAKVAAKAPAPNDALPHRLNALDDQFRVMRNGQGFWPWR